MEEDSSINKQILVLPVYRVQLIYSSKYAILGTDLVFFASKATIVHWHSQFNCGPISMFCP